MDHPEQHVGRLFKLVEACLRRLLGTRAGISALEGVSALSRSLSRDYCTTRARMLRAESEYLLHSNLSRYRQVVIVGGGAVPVTALHWAERYGGPVVVLEKSWFSAVLCQWFLRRSGQSNIQVVWIDGASFQDYAESIVLLSLHVENREAVLAQVLRSPGAHVIMVRLAREEQVVTQRVRWDTVVGRPGFRVLAAHFPSPSPT